MGYVWSMIGIVFALGWWLGSSSSGQLIVFGTSAWVCVGPLIDFVHWVNGWEWFGGQ